MGHRLLEKYVEAVRMDGIQTNKNVTIGQAGVNPFTTGGLTINGVLNINGPATFAGYSQATVLTLTPAATITVPSTNSIIELTPTGNETLNFPAASQFNVGIVIQLIVITSGTTSYTITLGTNTKNQGTLTTGTTSAVRFVFTFLSDGVNWNEVSRTTAM